MKKVIITGANGFVGRHCIDLLLRRGYEVHAVDQYPKALASGDAVQRHAVNLLKPGETDALLSRIRPSRLLHFAWYTTPGKYWTSNYNYTWLKASLDMLESFHKYGGERAVFAGSCAEYDWHHDVFIENVTPTSPETPYGICKNALRMIMESFAENNKMSWAWGRMFFLYGPHENPNRLVPSVITSLLQGKVAQCSDGELMRDFLYVSDVADAFLTLMDSDIQGPVNIASGVPVRIAQVVACVEKILSLRNMVAFGALQKRSNEPSQLIADTSRLRNEVGWMPMYDLESGIRMTVEWWKERLSKEEDLR